MEHTLTEDTALKLIHEELEFYNRDIEVLEGNCEIHSIDNNKTLVEYIEDWFSHENEYEFMLLGQLNRTIYEFQFINNLNSWQILPEWNDKVKDTTITIHKLKKPAKGLLKIAEFFVDVFYQDLDEFEGYLSGVSNYNQQLAEEIKKRIQKSYD